MVDPVYGHQRLASARAFERLAGGGDAANFAREAAENARGDVTCGDSANCGKIRCRPYNPKARHDPAWPGEAQENRCVQVFPA